MKRVENTRSFFLFNEVNKMEDSQEREKQNIEKKEKDVYFFQHRWKVSTQFSRRSEKSKNEK